MIWFVLVPLLAIMSYSNFWLLTLPQRMRVREPTLADMSKYANRIPLVIFASLGSLGLFVYLVVRYSS